MVTISVGTGVSGVTLLWENIKIIQAFCLGTYQQLFAGYEVTQGSGVMRFLNLSLFQHLSVRHVVFRILHGICHLDARR